MKGQNLIYTGTKSVVKDVEKVIDTIGYRKEFRQFQRKNNVKVAHLYSLYLQGYSLEHIANVIYQCRFTRQSLYDMFRVRGYKLRSKRLLSPRLYKGIAYRDSKGGYRSRINGSQLYLHKVIWEEHNGPIPAGYYILFKDNNRENIVIENLMCLPAQEAKKLYNYANQFGYKRFKEKGAFGELLTLK